MEEEKKEKRAKFSEWIKQFKNSRKNASYKDPDKDEVPTHCTDYLNDR